MTSPWTERALYDLIVKKYEQPAYVVLPQVANGTGFTRKTTRYADAIAMSLWPSRGLELHGFEIKCTKSDWRSELRNPEKSASIQSFMHRWWIVAPPDIVDPDELPITWGLLVAEKKRKMMLRVKKQAPLLVPKPIDYPFLAALLRRVAEHETPEAVLRVERDKGFRDGFRQGSDGWEKNYQQAMSDLDALRKRVKEFERVSGIQIEERWSNRHSAEEIGQAVRLVLDGVKTHLNTFRSLRNSAANVVAACDQAIDAIGGEK